jgi:hypothetical protein
LRGGNDGIIITSLNTTGVDAIDQKIFPKVKIPIPSSQVRAHDDQQIWDFSHLGLEERGVLKRLFGGVDGARADDDEKSVVLTGEDTRGAVARSGDGLFRGGGRGDLVA